MEAANPFANPGLRKSSTLPSIVRKDVQEKPRSCTAPAALSNDLIELELCESQSIWASGDVE